MKLMQGVGITQLADRHGPKKSQGTILMRVETNDKRTFLFTINASNDYLPFGSLEFHQKGQLDNTDIKKVKVYK